MEMEQCCDKLEIRDGQNGRIIATLKYSSINEPLLYTSTTGRLYITMTSDTSVPKRGFKADISVVTAENERLLSSCGFTSYASSTPAQILTPNYPDDHPPNMNCHWLIKAPTPNTQVELHIHDFRVEACCDHLEIRDGNNADSPMLTRLNDNLPANSTFTSTFGALYLRFFSDSSTNYRGFNGTYKIAGSTLPTTGPDSEFVSTCYSILKAQTSGVYGINNKTVTTCGEYSKCSLIRATTQVSAIGSGPLTEITYGACVPALSCEATTCDSLRTAIYGISAPISFNFTSCSATCCSDDLCNDDSGPGVTTAAPSSTEFSTSCYDTLKSSALGMTVLNSKRESFCPPESKCVLMKATTLTQQFGSPQNIAVDVVYGGCIPAVTCGFLTCDSMRNAVSGLQSPVNVTFSRCQINCCSGALCNDDTATTIPLPSPTGPTTGTGSQLSCYLGIRMSGAFVNSNNQVVSQCEIGSACLGIDATISASIPGSLSYSFDLSYGSCQPRESCNTVTCDLLQSLLPNTSAASQEITNCRAQCCDENFCNAPPIITLSTIPMTSSTPVMSSLPPVTGTIRPTSEPGSCYNSTASMRCMNTPCVSGV
uniref:uncharacterized protein LOC100181621 isoform X1 n=1 Tax=Ciona intestinalis TaxID=7719 RepID=UPI000EF4779B|nr:uncharacterized protein LOC100181621 isoform X1 [Ciona intestinalis]|eukprot:XP_026693090.1 uncharacterized protein LOC100181621 isoform X1 [Ciona intestinalis]